MAVMAARSEERAVKLEAVVVERPGPPMVVVVVGEVPK